LTMSKCNSPATAYSLFIGVAPPYLKTYFGQVCAWLKDFMEVGKERLTSDTVRDATKAEVQNIKRENTQFKQLVAELSLQMYVLKETAIPSPE
jgi:hypothetical protein